MNNNKKRDFTPINHQIRASKVICIDQNNNNLGEISISEALRMAQESNLDLVQVAFSNRIPTCKILDYGKFKYQQSKNEKAAAKKQRENTIKVKEIKFRPNTDLNDLRTKANKTKEILEEGNHIKISIVFKGREISYQQLAQETLKQFMDLVPELQLIEQPLITGKVLTAVGKKSTA